MNDDDGISWSTVAACGRATFDMNTQPGADPACDFCTAADTSADLKTVTIAPIASTAVDTYKIRVKRIHVVDTAKFEFEDYTIEVYSCAPITTLITHAVGSSTTATKMYQQTTKTQYETDCTVGAGRMTFPNGMPDPVFVLDTSDVYKVKFNGGTSKLVKYVKTWDIDVRYNDVSGVVINAVR
jgi:hypothetical protein